MKLTSLTSALALTLSLSTTVAFAQPKAPPKPKAGTNAVPAEPPKPEVSPGPKPLSETLTGEAKADYERAKMLIVGNQDWKNALINFQSAYEKSKDARLMWNIAACYKNEKKYARTVEHLRRYVGESGDLLTAQDRKDAQDLLAVIEPLTSTLELTVSENDAKVLLDGESLGKTPVPSTLVDVSSKQLTVTKDEFEPFSQTLDLGGTKNPKINVTLVRIKHEGKLTVRAGQNDEIFIDGQLVGRSLWSSTVKSGGYQLRVVAPGMKAYTTEVLINDKDDRTVPVTLEKEKSSGLPLWAYIAGGAVLVGGGITAAVIAVNQKPGENTVTGTFSPGSTQAFIKF